MRMQKQSFCILIKKVVDPKGDQFFYENKLAPLIGSNKKSIRMQKSIPS